jgi:hypothetical protein
MILYKDGYALDSSKQQEIHGILFPPFFFDTEAARVHWEITTEPAGPIAEEIAAESPPDAVLEAVDLSSFYEEIESVEVVEKPKAKKTK